MQPDEQTSGQGGAPLLEQRSDDSMPVELQSLSQKAAADIVRNQISGIFGDQQAAPEPTVQQQSQPQATQESPYNRTHQQHPQPQADQWKHYHTAWQEYYQKYYEGYYTHNLNIAKNNAKNAIPTDSPKQPLTSNEAIVDLRKQLLSKVQKTSQKVKKSRHFMPIIAGVIVILIFLILQYNRVLISNVVAYISPGSINPQNIIVKPSDNIIVGPEPRLIIPKINVDVPVHYDIGNDYTSQMKAMESGVAHFAIPGASSHPGQVGNTVIAGHSSNDLLDYGDYKFIFVQLEKLNIGDVIYADYQSKRYTYIVTKTEVVSPTDVQKLVYPTTKPVITLLTCTPIGTATSRLFVIGEQISPDPSKSIAAPVTNSKTTDKTSIPGNSPTLWERIFGS